MRCVQKQELMYRYTVYNTMHELNPNAQRILEYIQQNPGCHQRQIKKDLELAMGTTQHHLNILESMGRIISERHSLHRSYYAAGVFEKNEKQILKILHQETARNILLFIMEIKNPTQTEIIDRIKISGPSVHWHIQRLIRFGVINEIRDGKYKRYSLVYNSYDIVKIIKNYHPAIWERWSDRLAEMFLSMGMSEKNGSD